MSYRGSVGNEYFDYLTYKLDHGISTNLVSLVVSQLAVSQANLGKVCKILDVGCFNGSMLNRILQDVPQDIRPHVKCIGVDNDVIVLISGHRKFRNVGFVCGSPTYPLPLSYGFDVAILSNILHEVFSESYLQEKSHVSAINTTISAISNTSNLLVDRSYLVIQDGILPEDSERLVDIRFHDENSFHEFLRFCKEYFYQVPFTSLSNNKIRLSLHSLSLFLTKRRYLSTGYWSLEANQIYPIFSESDYRRILSSLGYDVISCNFSKVSESNRKFDFVYSEQQSLCPAKNVVIVARKKP